MPATTPPLRSELDAHGQRSRDVRRTSLHALPKDGGERAPRLPFSTKGKVPVATTIVLFAIVGALIAFIAIAD